VSNKNKCNNVKRSEGEIERDYSPSPPPLITIPPSSHPLTTHPATTTAPHPKIINLKAPWETTPKTSSKYFEEP
jgi:hypothetical protein